MGGGTKINDSCVVKDDGTTGTKTGDNCGTRSDGTNITKVNDNHGTIGGTDGSGDSYDGSDPFASDFDDEEE